MSAKTLIKHLAFKLVFATAYEGIGLGCRPCWETVVEGNRLLIFADLGLIIALRISVT